MAEPSEERAEERRAGELLQTAAVIAGIALALAALLDDKHQGPAIRHYHPLIITLLTGGVCCLVGTAYAMYALWDENGLSKADIWPFRTHRTAHAGALVATTWGLIFVLVAYVLLLIAATP